MSNISVQNYSVMLSQWCDELSCSLFGELVPGLDGNCNNLIIGVFYLV